MTGAPQLSATELRPLFAAHYYVDCGQSWPDPPTGLTLCTTASPQDMTAMREPDQMLADWGVPLLCVVVLELLLRWREAWSAARAQARRDANASPPVDTWPQAAWVDDGPGHQTGDTAADSPKPGMSETGKAGGPGRGRAPMKGGISRGGYWAGLFACMLLFFGMAQSFTGWRGIDPSLPGMLAALLMLTCLAVRRLRSQGLRPAWALPTLVMPLLLFLGTLVPSLQRDWFLVWPEISPRHFSLMLFVYLWTLAFFIGLGLFSVTRRRRARRG